MERLLKTLVSGRRKRRSSLTSGGRMVVKSLLAKLLMRLLRKVISR